MLIEFIIVVQSSIIVKYKKVEHLKIGQSSYVLLFGYYYEPMHLKRVHSSFWGWGGGGAAGLTMSLAQTAMTMVTGYSSMLR